MNRILIAAVVSALPFATFAQDDAHLAQSRELVKRFAEQLQSELLRAMAHDGPIAAVGVCSDRAPFIAAQLSRQSGAKIGRTSLRFRNPANAPEPWQYEVLERFDERAANARPSELEVFEQSPGPGVESRYMKAIVAQPMCLTCHGKPDRSVRDAIRENYPHDLATRLRGRRNSRRVSRHVAGH